MADVLIRGMEMPQHCGECGVEWCNRWKNLIVAGMPCAKSRPADCPLTPVPDHGRLRKRIVYRGEVYNAIEAARVNALDGILSDRYKDGFHDGLKKALEILADVEDAPTVIPADKEET